MNDDFWESQHPNSPLFTPIQQIPQSPTPTVQMALKKLIPFHLSMKKFQPLVQMNLLLLILRLHLLRNKKFLSLKNLSSRFLRW